MADTGTPTAEPEPDTDLSADLNRMATALFSAGSATETLTRVVDLAVSTIEGCDFAGVFLVVNGEVTTPVCTDPLAAEVDGLQHRFKEGPCLAAMAQGITFYAEDLADDARWPTFGPAATVAGVRSLLALPLLVPGVPGALNLYARYPRAFGVIDRGKALLLAGMAGLAYASVHTHEDDDRRATNLHAAVGHPRGDRTGPGDPDGTGAPVLQRGLRHPASCSQHLNLKLRDVAQNLVDTGERPDTGLEH